MAYWLVKQEPESYSWDDFAAEGTTMWDGVRNYQARNFLRAMEEGDDVLFYASGKRKAVMGTARVVRAGYPDPTAQEGDWTAVDLEAGEPFPHPVELAEVRADPVLAETALVRQSRLSVMPLTEAQYRRFLELGGLAPRRKRAGARKS